MTSDSLPNDDFDRLARLLAGEGTVAEREETERWVAADPARQAALEAMRVAWTTPLPETSVDVDAAWGVLSSRIRSAKPQLKVSSAPARSAPIPADLARHVSIATGRSRRRWWQDGARLLQVAAAAVVLIGGAVLLPRMRPSAAGDGTFVAAASTAVSTAAGERRTVRLPDGSSVMLGVASTLRTRAGYGDGPREVELEGEGFFTVTHDEAHPFRVIVNGTIVEDLGTEFAVRGYDRSAPIRVAVASGSVAVRRGTTSDTAVVLAPRDVATVTAGGDVTVQRGIDVAPFTAFASGRLIFEDAALSDVASELTRWYGVEVRITDSTLLDRHLTSTFEGESLDEVLRIIGMTIDVQYSRDGAAVEISGKKARTSVRPTSPSTATALAEAGA